MKFYGYSGCGTCKKAKQWLTAQGIAFDEIAIREQPPSKRELQRMVEYLDRNVMRLFNTSGKDYREMGGKAHFSTLSTDEVFTALAANGNLIKRPFVLVDDDGVVGFKADVWADKFGSSR